MATPGSPRPKQPATTSDDQQLTASTVGQYVDKHLINRMHRLSHVWRFMLGWLLLVVLIVFLLINQLRSLEDYHTKLVPKAGGTYVEGVIGPLTNVNPIFASTPADQAASRLIFSSLLRYDVNNRLTTDLAESITSDDKAGRYTVKLKPDLYWHDGAVLDADDVVFTVEMIKNPKTRSNLQHNLQGVSVDAVDQQTVVFSLTSSFSPFPNLLTFGILPEHILQGYRPEQLRTVAFNSSEAVGSGPFKLQRLVNVTNVDSDSRELKLQLVANPRYHHGAPLLEAFTLWAAPSTERLLQLLRDGKLTAVSGLQDQLPTNYGQIELNRQLFDLTSGVYLFFKTSNPLLAEAELRQALAKAINIHQVLRLLDHPVQTISGPLLPEQLGYDPDLTQPSFNRQQAITGLQSLGWRLASDGVRVKDGQRLSLLLTTQKGTDYQRLAEEIAKQLSLVGVEVGVDLREGDSFAKNVLQDHAYSHLLLYGLNLGADPDVYPFWHSSQIGFQSPIRLNLAEYDSEAVDTALESGRSRVEADLRASKYHDFQAAWIADLPAVALYRPRFSYYELANVRGPRGTALVSPLDRFRDVHLWTVLTTRVEIDQTDSQPR